MRVPPKDRFRSDTSPTPGPDRMAALLKRCGIDLTAGQVDQLWSYHQLLRQHNPELNLTRVHNFANMVLKLYADSILPGRLVSLPSPLLDLGTGAGMPGVPLKIAFPPLKILLAESRQKRVDFLNLVLDQLHLRSIEVVGEGVTPAFEVPVAGVITRAVESIAETLARIRGCLDLHGQAIFMKGPGCDAEIEEALRRFEREYRLVRNQSYQIPHTPHERRLVIFERLDEPLRVRKVQAMKRLPVRKIESEQNPLFKDLKKLLTSRGIKKQQRAIVSGPKQVDDILRGFPERCEAWISPGDSLPPPSSLLPEHLAWFQLPAAAFSLLDLFGTRGPLLLVKTQPIPAWQPADGLPEGCSVFVPFQDPENVGAVIRSAVAFGASRIILLSESAHPYHPKALRASGGAVLNAPLFEGPSLEELPDDLPLIPLSMEGREIAGTRFPKSFGLLPGIEGPGLPQRWRDRALSIPIRAGVESLNAATATAIALYVWSRSVAERDENPDLVR